jgi:SAM-dependent methyltransferase
MNAEEIKLKVREAYAAGVESREGCCEDTGVERSRGARTSFGCGDPLALVAIQPGQTVLDVGSGPGADVIAAARRVGPTGRAIGVDMTPEMIRRARENAAKEGLGNAEFHLAEAEKLPIPDATVDWVISNCVVNLVPDKPKAFREIFRVLKPGGRFSITDLVGENLPPEILADPAKYCACIGGAPSEAAYLQAARDAGLDQIEVLDRFRWEAKELESSGGKVWSIKVTGRRPAHGAAIEPALPADLPEIEQLLSACGLPFDGAADHLGRFIVARRDGRVAGCVGFEQYGSACVLRSLAVLPEVRGLGLGAALIDEIIERARRVGCRDAYLLTLTIETMAAQHGFTRVKRTEVQEEAQKSAEFSLDCCASAVIMHRRLG